MKKPNTEQVDTARRLLAHEAQGVKSVEERAAATGRVHHKFFARLASLLGAGGARALFARSVQVRTSDYPCLRNVNLDAKTENPAEQIMLCLRGEDPAAAVETSVALSATLLALLTTLIGERLTFQVLRSAWPTFDVSAPTNEETER